MATKTSPQKPVYHKGTPKDKTCFRRVNEFRAKVIQFFACPTPGLKNTIPLLGGRTVIELLGVIVVMALPIALAGAGGAIDAANVSGLICILLALRFNYALKLLNLSFERALFWHKIMAIVFLVTMIIHAASKGANTTGLIIVCSAGIMSLAYLSKPYFFEVFYYIHLSLLVVCCAACFVHGARLVFYGLLVWIADLVLRYGIFARRITARAFVLPGNVVRLEFPRAFSYEAGQYCFLRIYDVNPFEFHPFSLSSSPYDDTTTIHIRALGDWTAKLLKYVEEKESFKGAGAEINLLCEGPFGMGMIDWENNDEYEVFLLVSGGVGITPMQSIFTQLIHEQQNFGRRVRKAVFVWSAKDLSMVHAFNDAEQGNYTHRISHIGAPAGKAQLPSTVAAGDLVEEIAPKGSSKGTTTPPRKNSISLENMPRNFQPMMADIPEVFYEVDLSTGKRRGPPSHFVNPVTDENGDAEAQQMEAFNKNHRNDSMSDTLYSIASHLVFLPRFHITSLKSKADIYTSALEASASSGIETENATRQFILKPGRPNLTEIFSELRTMCEKEGIRKVAVMVCGPQPMVNDVHDLCRQSRLQCGSVQFDCHKEVFDF